MRGCHGDTAFLYHPIRPSRPDRIVVTSGHRSTPTTAADDPVDVCVAQVTCDRDEQGDHRPVERAVNTHDRWAGSGCLDWRDARLKFSITHSAGHVGVAYGVVRRQVDLTRDVDRFTVVFAEEKPDGIEVVVVGLDTPVATNRTSSPPRNNRNAPAKCPLRSRPRHRAHPRWQTPATSWLSSHS